MMPYVSENGGVTVGQKNTTVFLVDVETGRVVYGYESGHSASTTTLGFRVGEDNPVLQMNGSEGLMESGSGNVKMGRQLIYILRKDYVLQFFSPNSEPKEVWNVAFADIEAEFRCQEFENPFDGYPSHSGNELFEYLGDSELPFPCQTRVLVSRIRDDNLLEEFLSLGGIVGGLPSLPAAGHNHPLSLVSSHPNHEDRHMLALPRPEIENPFSLEMLGGSGSKSELNNKSTFDEKIKGSHIPSIVTSFITTIICIIGFLFYRSKQGNLNKQAEDLKVQAGITKKKKSRRPGNNKNNANSEKNQNLIAHETKFSDAIGLPHFEGNEKKSLLTFTGIVDGHVDGRRIGRLLVSNKEIAKGSNGTIVLEGIYDGRPVAVKRLVQTHHDVALKEIQNLIASDQHPNIVRWYGVEFDKDFVYLSLERCTCSLNDLIYVCSGTFHSQKIANNQETNSLDELTIQLCTVVENNKDIELWKANGYPTAQLLKLMRDLVSGLSHLHDLGIVHRDLKPQNVLINTERSLCAKLSDMGISKRLHGDMSSLTQNASGYGSSGWQAPEQLLHGRQTRAVDLFSLGCVLFFCMTGGKHPYGDSFERDVNIVNDRKDLFLVENVPEAVNLFSQLLNPCPDMRPKAQDILHHPFFWTSEIRLSFLRDVSDRVELEDREKGSELLTALEGIVTVALNGKWDEKMEAAFIDNIGRYRRYKYDSIRDLLRVIRNKSNHYRELPQDIQELLGSLPEGFYNYFSSRFPKLLIEVYEVINRYCKEEEFFQKYVKTNLV
ncbi:serine/threonine-protein kinase/endoribonuclease IRE1b-like isoform X3 [Mangifera indica]|nr:serine/threonine-protein kinase/endoribonuclease IRE1b-like isoform X3 [Mangifera indica]